MPTNRWSCEQKRAFQIYEKKVFYFLFAVLYQEQHNTKTKVQFSMHMLNRALDLCRKVWLLFPSTAVWKNFLWHFREQFKLLPCFLSGTISNNFRNLPTLQKVRSHYDNKDSPYSWNKKSNPIPEESIRFRNIYAVVELLKYGDLLSSDSNKGRSGVYVHVLRGRERLIKRISSLHLA